MTKEELEKEATEYAQKLGAKDFIAKPKEIVAYFGYLAGAEPREKRIAELEKRCANYEMKISKMEKGTCDVCKEIEKDKKIAELEKENAELKDDNKVMADNYSKMEQKFYDNLAKAKKLLKQFLEAKNGEDTYKAEWEAEQFIKEEK